MTSSLAFCGDFLCIACCTYLQLYLLKFETCYGLLLIYSRCVQLSIVLCLVRKEPDEEDSCKADDNDEKKDDSRPSSIEQTILYPHEVKHHMRQLWDNDKHILRHVLRAFAVNVGSMEYPVDIFFKQVQPIIPTRYRPVCTECSAFSAVISIVDINSFDI